MMLTSEQNELLQSLLGGLPEPMALRLAKAVEVDRLAEKVGLPHETILEGLRPMLCRGETLARTPTPLRLFCQPFEDLLVSAARKEKRQGRIARSSMVPVWNWLERTLIPEETKSYCEDAKSLVLACKPEEAMTRAGAFWPLAGEALHSAVTKNRKEARSALESEMVLADAEEMALLLIAGPAMVEIQKILPKRASTMTDEILWKLRAIYDRLIESAPDAAPYVAVVAMERLTKPWEALRLALLVSRRTEDTLISLTDMGLVGDIMFAEMEDCRTAILAVRHPGFDADALIAQLARFTDLSCGIVKEVDIRREGKWGKRLLKDRAAVGSVMETLMERAPGEIATALPVQQSGFTGGPLVPDFAKPASPERIDRALRYAKLLTGCKHLAVPASFGAKHTDAMNEVVDGLRRYNDDVVKELRTAEGTRRIIVESQLALATELTAILFSEEEAEFLRRRGKAALPPAE
jgi:hypothetical protein